MYVTVKEIIIFLGYPKRYRRVESTMVRISLGGAFICAGSFLVIKLQREVE